MDPLSVLEQAAKFLSTQESPSPDTVVAALLATEKARRQSRLHSSASFTSLMGNWRLCFITGTKKTQQKAGIVLGPGRYLPSWVKVKLSYSAVSFITPVPPGEVGQIENQVEVGLLKLIITGPTQFLSHQNILAFDFTRIQVQLFGMPLYQGYIRGGVEKEQKFYQKSVKNQAFFAYFLIQENLIAARGRGGGLALWSREVA